MLKNFYRFGGATAYDRFRDGFRHERRPRPPYVMLPAQQEPRKLPMEVVGPEERETLEHEHAA